MTAIVKQEAQLAAAADNQLEQYWRKHYGEKLSDIQFAFFISTAQRLGLEPGRQLFAVLRTEDGESKMVLQTGIDGYRAIAARTGELDGISAPEWADVDGIWRECWTQKTPPSAARIRVFRKGCSQPFTAVCAFREFVQLKKTGEPNSMWAKMPANQLAKCAEAAALRKAFPSVFESIYTEDEMGQADNERGQAQFTEICATVEAAQTREECEAIWRSASKLLSERLAGELRQLLAHRVTQLQPQLKA